MTEHIKKLLWILFKSDSIWTNYMDAIWLLWEVVDTENIYGEEFVTSE